MAQSKFGVIQPLTHDTCFNCYVYCDNTAFEQIGVTHGMMKGHDEGQTAVVTAWLDSRPLLAIGQQSDMC
jgi:hypothetical protein